MSYEPNHQVCDYEGSAYRTEFWGQDRDYEDAVERVALKHMLPLTGNRLIDIGAGYGRLVPLYSGHDEVVLFDYAMSQLRQAQKLWGSSGPQGHPRYIYVAGDFYRLPFAPTTFDTVVMVRTLHHAADPPSVLRGVSEILAPRGSFILEFANKRNLKAVLRYLAGRQDWSPFNRTPVEFVPLNFDFHPAWIEELLSKEGLRIRQRRAVSSFRLGSLKRLLPTQLLVILDRVFQPMGELLPLSPSVFIRCEADAHKSSHSDAALFRCIACGSTHLKHRTGRLFCANCGTAFPIQSGIYNFKAPLPEARERSTDQPQSSKPDSMEKSG